MIGDEIYIIGVKTLTVKEMRISIMKRKLVKIKLKKGVAKDV